MNNVVRLATRGSPLARHQAALVAERLTGAGIGEIELVVVETSPDRLSERPIASFAGTGAFTAEVDARVAEEEADIAVHSAKDLPTRFVDDGLVLAALLERSEVRDALVGKRLTELVPGDVVRTGSVRRRAQLAALRPGLVFEELRGNIGTRLSKVPPSGAIVVAYVALQRLGLADRASEVLSAALMLPQVGQGAIALRCRSDDATTLQILREIDDPPTHVAVLAERAFLFALGESCQSPVGALATVLRDSGLVEIEGFLARADGSASVRRTHRGDDPESVGAELARLLLDEDGGRALLEG